MVVCFAGLPDYSLLASLAGDVGALAFTEDRSALDSRVLGVGPAAVLFPPVDVNGLTCAPLIARVRDEAPDVPVIVLVSPLRARVGLAESIRAGAEPATCRSRSELTSLIEGLSGVGFMSARELDAARALVSTLDPPFLVEYLVHCVRHAPRRLTVAALADLVGVSPRTLSRHLRCFGWPAPAEVIEWGQLLHASMLSWRFSASLLSLAHGSGFASQDDLRRATARLVGVRMDPRSDLSPLAIRVAIRRRLGSMQRALGSI